MIFELNWFPCSVKSYPISTSRILILSKEKGLPVVKDDHKWDFKHIKHLCGKGRLYVRLNVSKDTLFDVDTDIDQTDSVESDDGQKERTLETSLGAEIQPFHSEIRHQPESNVEQLGPDISVADPQQGTSGAASRCFHVEDSIFIQDGLNSLSNIFPNKRRELLEESLMVHQNLEAAANYLSEHESSLGDGNFVHGDEDAVQIFKRLKGAMKPYIFAEKVKIDKDDMLMDLFSIYKGPDFDPHVQLKLQIRVEPAVDTGGVLRQSFSSIFGEIAQGSCYQKLFRGPNTRLTPFYSSHNVLTGIFDVLGKMVAHSLVQGGPDFPYLAPGIFWYVATGDLSEAVGRSSFIGVGDLELATFFERVCEANFNNFRSSYFLLIICQKQVLHSKSPLGPSKIILLKSTYVPYAFILCMIYIYNYLLDNYVCCYFLFIGLVHDYFHTNCSYKNFKLIPLKFVKATVYMP